MSGNKDYKLTWGVVPVRTALSAGDIYTKLTTIIMGCGNFARKQWIQGLLFLAVELTFIYYMITIGVQSLIDFSTLGTKIGGEQFNEAKGVFEYTQGDNSMLLLLGGVVTIFVILAFVVVWRAAIRSAYYAQERVEEGKQPVTFQKTITDLFDKNLHKGLLFLPIMGIVTFMILPLLFMILIAFTNYDRDHIPPGNLFDWVGFQNFSRILSASGDLAATFWPILGWTIVWAFFATFLNYVLGMILAIIINRKGTKFKQMWRFIFALTIAIPQFVSLLVVNTMIQEHGVFNLMLEQLFGAGPVPFLTNVTVARITVIVINLWIGIPFTIIQITGILQNIPTELYEAADIDGAGPATTFFKITLPYMLFVTTPYLIQTFIGNINNFNVIFLLTGGAPAASNYYKGTAGKTDLLITWLYKLTIDNKDYSIGSVIGILVFIIMATGSLIAYRSTGSYKNEEGFL
ncbi:sugar ABC transporter permease [Clostridiales bacterium COT073_COT-073]|nr:sugar ABC transporter permease [Clostridiales bacterium COT073_COT-073]